RVLVQEILDFTQGDPASAVDRKTVGAGADRRKRNRAEAVLLGQREAALITACQQVVLVVFAAVPDRADRMDYVFRRQLVAFGDAGVASGTAAQLAALFQEPRPGGPVDRAIDAAAAQERFVRRVHNRVHFLLCDVALDDFKSFGPSTFICVHFSLLLSE